MLETATLLVLAFCFFAAVPDSAPPNVVVDKRSSTSIRCRWGSFSSLSLWNGIGIGYEVQYRLKGEESRNWTSVEISGASNRQYLATGLLKYRVYEFKVAGRTIKGSGIFSATREERTMEDGIQSKLVTFQFLLALLQLTIFCQHHFC